MKAGIDPASVRRPLEATAIEKQGANIFESGNVIEEPETK